jgi:hypothetical protein
VLATLAFGGRAIPVAWRERGTRVAAVGLLLYGGWTLARGGAGLGAEEARKVLPECCTETEGAASDPAALDLQVEGSPASAR